MQEKFYWFMICYTWRANNQSGNGSNILCGDSDQIHDKDISTASDSCKDFVSKKMHYDKESIQIIFTNIIKLAHCTRDEFYEKDDAE